MLVPNTRSRASASAAQQSNSPGVGKKREGIQVTSVGAELQGVVPKAWTARVDSTLKVLELPRSELGVSKTMPLLEESPSLQLTPILRQLVTATH